MNTSNKKAYSCESVVNQGLDAIVAFHVVAEPHLDDLVLGDRRSHSIQKFCECGKPDALEVLALRFMNAMRHPAIVYTTY